MIGVKLGLHYSKKGKRNRKVFFSLTWPFSASPSFQISIIHFIHIIPVPFYSCYTVLLIHVTHIASHAITFTINYWKSPTSWSKAQIPKGVFFSRVRVRALKKNVERFETAHQNLIFSHHARATFAVWKSGGGDVSFFFSSSSSFFFFFFPLSSCSEPPIWWHTNLFLPVIVRTPPTLARWPTIMWPHNHVAHIK